MAALNIQIEVPNLSMYEIEHAKKFVAASKKTETVVVSKQYRHELLAGIFSDEYSADELRNEYLQEKYGV